MKTLFSSKTLIAVAVAVAAAAAIAAEASEQPMPPPASDGALPAGIPLGSPAGQVYKLAQAGVDESVIQNYIANCPSAFNLDADEIIALTDVGLPKDLISAMFTHDKNLPPANNSAPAPMPAPGTVVSSSTPPPVADNSTPTVAPPTQEVTVNNFYDNLAPYGSWVEVAGYGRCWRPTVVVYDSNWRPYCDRGRWVYTDCGWYWDSEYSWGVTFHYGRWFCDARYGWCWWPDTVWAPSWVTWRSGGQYCGWAPLPPFTVYQPGIGFVYRGNHVAVGFDFGLAANFFTFVSIGDFCQPHPRHYCLPPQRVTQIYNQTTIINNYSHNNRTIVNNGVSVTTIGQATRHPIQAVPISTLVNPGRRGWPSDSSPRHTGTEAIGNPATRNYINSAPVSNGGEHNRTATPSAVNNSSRNNPTANENALRTAPPSSQKESAGVESRQYQNPGRSEYQRFVSPRYAENNNIHYTAPAPVPAKQSSYNQSQNYNGSGGSAGQSGAKQYRY
jgi:hypothetical protein